MKRRIRTSDVHDLNNDALITIQGRHPLESARRNEEVTEDLLLRIIGGEPSSFLSAPE